MKEFAQLIHTLDSTNKNLQKIAAIELFIKTASNEDKLWFLSLFTGKRPKRSVTTKLLKQWILEETKLPEWLFAESYAAVGDLGETIALLLPNYETRSEKSLSQYMDEITALKDATEDEKRAYVVSNWHAMSSTERFIFNKLLGGSFRIGVSSKTVINALAKYFDKEPAAVTHSIMGEWRREDVDFEGLITGAYTQVNKSKPYPFCLAYALDKDLKSLGNISDWQIEYKWDGIRAQVIKRDGSFFIWSRGEELITNQFPEIEAAFANFPYDFVIDGELLVVKNQEVYNFSELQKRLNRKKLPKKMLDELPVSLYIYDVLEWQNQDLRTEALANRRAVLERYFNTPNQESIHLSPVINEKSWDQLAAIRNNARAINSEGLMLKNLHSPYHTGRKRGDWWKWKTDPLTIDAVLIYAQKGSGRRSGYYTDYTFAVKNGNELVTIAKAYSGLTDKEIQEVSKFVNQNAIEKFGPVRTVKPELVFEIAFEGIGFSSRHKSGVALRFPRILRWRKDKNATQIDDLEDVKRLIT
ncbi:ATP-dependent DNA ligase [Flavobacterium sp. CBA20B-1]|uniref:ATP-dependent DNA ligase n=1 Tax=unclassified Flavobacterium TaxID=196869 RepID=UPI00222587AD|nr:MULTISPECIES: ATP-dependent DNA ligase [unclassified Flavobacterium]WCM41833.1 ATP-dependent DNA ligase [Flavobacterium sp. CBA20B-1]